jgi:hypothetical protein
MDMDKQMGTLKTMLAEMQERMDANTKTMREDMKASQAKADAQQAKMEARMDAKMGSMQAALKSAIKDIKFNREETMACQGTMEARLEEYKPASMDTTPEVARDQEVPREDAEVMPVEEPRKRRRDRRNLAVGRRQKKEKRILDARHREKQRDLVAARRGTTRRAAVARRRILPTKDTNRELHGS